MPSLPFSRDADEGMPRIVRRNPSKPVTKFCINCLSPLEKGSELGGWLVPQDYYCKNCGYKGYVYLEDRRSEDEGLGEGNEAQQTGDRDP
ncbi:MAG: hypothetical protein OK442_01800 [Thaumarchaeota archaeon]|nr:hypothetical protein [Nitrososphaerota archaeon]